MSDSAATQSLRELLTSGTYDPGATYGWKVAINFPDGQRRLGLTRALAAPLTGERRHPSGSTLSFSADSKVFVEAEIAVCLAEDVDQVLTTSALRACIASYAPCLELVDYALPADDLPTMLRHSFFHSGVVLGESVLAARFGGVPAPLPRAESSEGKTRTRFGGTVPDDVVLAVQQLGEQVLASGGSLRGGQLILCGSYIDPIALRVGSTIRVEFGPGLSTLTVSRAA